MLNSKGFTTIELLMVLGILIGGSGAVAIIWVACHFIAKWW